MKNPTTQTEVFEEGTVQPVSGDALALALPQDLQSMMNLVKDGAAVESFKELVGLFRDERAYQSERKFNDAFAAFKRTCPPITHNKNVYDKSDKRLYGFAALSHITSIVDPLLNDFGFSYSWDETFENNRMDVVCTLRHLDGHQRTAKFACPISKAPLQSDAQAAKGAMSFGHRCSLIAVLGLSTADPDNDGADNEDTIGPGQLQEIKALILEVAADEKKIRQLFDVESLEQLTLSNYTPVVRMLEAKRK